VTGAPRPLARPPRRWPAHPRGGDPAPCRPGAPPERDRNDRVPRARAARPSDDCAPGRCAGYDDWRARCATPAMAGTTASPPAHAGPIRSAGTLRDQIHQQGKAEHDEAERDGHHESLLRFREPSNPVERALLPSAAPEAGRIGFGYRRDGPAGEQGRHHSPKPLRGAMSARTDERRDGIGDTLSLTRRRVVRPDPRAEVAASDGGGSRSASAVTIACGRPSSTRSSSRTCGSPRRPHGPFTKPFTMKRPSKRACSSGRRAPCSPPRGVALRSAPARHVAEEISLARPDDLGRDADRVVHDALNVRTFPREHLFEDEDAPGDVTPNGSPFGADSYSTGVERFSRRSASSTQST
jgi:hypothetical protein